MQPLLIGDIGTPELLIMLAIVILSSAPPSSRSWLAAAAVRCGSSRPRPRAWPTTTTTTTTRRPTAQRRARGPSGSRARGARGSPASAGRAPRRHRPPDRVRRRRVHRRGRRASCAANRSNPVGADGRMALSDHFRELRARLIRSALLLVILFFVAIYFYDQLLELVQHPYNEAQQQLARQRHQHRGRRQRRHRRSAAADEAVRRRRADRGEPLLALPDLGVRAARAAREREEVHADVRRGRRAAVHRRRRAGLLRAPQGPRRC